MGMKCYRCGWCGQPCYEDGSVIPYDDLIASFTDADYDNAEMVHGDCCPRDPNTSEPRVVTREMAMDAQNPDLEGTEW